MILTPKNWKSFQHYTDRKPTWIKLHRAILDDYDYWCLPVASKALAPCLWLLASEYTDGKIKTSLDELAFRFRMTRGEVAEALSPLIEKGFFDASEPLAECYQPASLEKERETEEEKRERREETREDALSLAKQFDQFWEVWPNRVGKTAALKAFRSAMKRATFAEIMDGVQSYIRDKPPDRSWLNPATFLNQNRWEDKPAAVGVRNGTSGNISSACDKLISVLDAGFGRAPPQEQAGGGADETDVRLLSYGRG